MSMNYFYHLRLKEGMHDRIFRLRPHLDICLTRKALDRRVSWLTGNLGFIRLHLLSLEPLWL